MQWQYCGLITQSIHTDDVDNALVSQLLIKATYFLYGFNYLFCDLGLCALYVGCMERFSKKGRYQKISIRVSGNMPRAEWIQFHF